MNDLPEKLQNLKTHLTLTSEERLRIRAHLEALPTLTPRNTRIPSPYTPSFFFGTPMRMVSAFLAVVVVGLGGTTAFAGSALPGDVLYSVKVHVNEKIERSLALTPYAKATVDIAHAEERLTEVELLAARGEATKASTEAAHERVIEKIAAVQSVADTLTREGDSAGAADIQSRIESRLLAHADILHAQAEELPDDSKSALRTLSDSVTLVTKKETEVQGTSTDSVIAKMAYDRQGAAKKGIDTLTKALTTDGVLQSTHTQIAEELERIQDAYTRTNTSLQDKDYRTAMQGYKSIERRAYRALALFSSAQRIQETTGKEVVVAIAAERDDKEKEVGAGTTTTMMAASAPAPEPSLTNLGVRQTMKTASSAPSMESAKEQVRSKERKRDGLVQFDVRPRENNGGKRDKPEEEDRESH